MSAQKTVVIVGAGAGGIACAARLAQAGVRVLVLEKNDFTGGRCSLIHHEGHRFDQGPSLLLLPELFNETFRDLGTSMTGEGVELLQCQPNYTMHFSDGETFTISTDLNVMKEQIEKYEGKSGFEAFLDFLKESHRHYELSLTHVLHKNYTSLLSLLDFGFLSNVFDLHPFESMYRRASVYFTTERLRRVFTFASMYMGMSPFDAPGTYSLLQYTEFARGIWYPRGGFHAVIAALAKVAERSGAAVRLSTPVRHIFLSENGKRAAGVVLESGEVIEADAVIINADLVYAYNNLFAPSPSLGGKAASSIISYAKRLTSRAASCSSISFYWSLNRRLGSASQNTRTPLSAHNIFLADAYRESFDAIFKDHSMPADPSFYINIPSLLDRSAAPDDESETVVVLVPVGHLKDDPNSSGKGVDDSEAEMKRLVDRARKQVLETIKARTGEDWTDYIRHEIVNNPVVWKERFNLDRGAILGLSHSFLNVLSFRPTTQHPYISSCYFVGASTHPGTGVPIVLAGAKITSEQVLLHLGLEIPWPLAASYAETAEPLNSRDELNRIRRRAGISTGLLWAALLSALITLLAIALGRMH